MGGPDVGPSEQNRDARRAQYRLRIAGPEGPDPAPHAYRLNQTRQPHRRSPRGKVRVRVQLENMAKKMLIDATHAEETRVVVVDGNKVEEFDFESAARRQLAGSIYLAKVTRVEPSLQAAFIDYGGNRHGFLAFAEIHPDYYQIPVADREALLAEEMADAQDAADDEDDGEDTTSGGASGRGGRSRGARTRSRSRTQAAASKSDPTATQEPSSMDVIDLGADDADDAGPMALGDAAPDARADARADAAKADAPEAETGASETETNQAEFAATDAAATEAFVQDDTPSDQPPPSGDTPAQADAPDATEAAPKPRSRSRSRRKPAAKSAKDAPQDSDDADDNAPATARDRNDDETGLTTVDKDDTIETVADKDDTDEVRPVRKPRARRYKIQEVIKVRQIMLVQVVKEERGNKGAALTTYLSLAGRYCVLMPNTARGGGISRKITNAADRKKLKEIANEIEVPRGAGLIIRTAGSQRTRAEIKRDYEYLQRLWEQIRELTLKSIAPAKIYEEGDLIKRSIRDLYSKEIDEVIVEGANGYRTAKDFMKMIMPSHAKNVKLHGEGIALFARHGVEGYLAGMFNPTVQLPSGGYIVIGITEALVAIDVNSGRSTKEGSIEQTALKTNLEASDEVARQLRLRDLAGLIVIDYIDMDERKNNAAVEKRFKDSLKDDRARIQVGRISGFGLLEMSRQRLRPGMLEATTQPCVHCHGTGLLRSDDNVSLGILRQLEEEGARGRTKEVLVKVPHVIMNFLMNQKREMIAQIEMRYGMAVRVEGDHSLVSPDFALEKFKTATRTVPEAGSFVSSSAVVMDDEDEDFVEEAEIEDAVVVEAEAAPAETPGETADADGQPKKKRRRRRRRRGAGDGDNGSENDTDAAASADGGAEAGPEAAADAEADEAARPKRTRTRSRKASETEDAPQTADAGPVPEAVKDAPQEAKSDAPDPKPRRRSRARKPAADAAPEGEAPVSDAATSGDATPEDATPGDAPAPKPKPKRRSRAKKVADPAPEVAETVAAEDQAERAPEVKQAAVTPEPETSVEPETAMAPPPEPAEPVSETAPAAQAEDAARPDAPKRRGWWSLGRS